MSMAYTYASSLATELHNLETDIQLDIQDLRNKMDNIFGPPGTIVPWHQLEIDLINLQQENSELKERIEKLEFLSGEN